MSFVQFRCWYWVLNMLYESRSFPIPQHAIEDAVWLGPNTSEL